MYSNTAEYYRSLFLMKGMATSGGSASSASIFKHIKTLADSLEVESLSDVLTAVYAEIHKPVFHGLGIPDDPDISCIHDSCCTGIVKPRYILDTELNQYCKKGYNILHINCRSLKNSYDQLCQILLLNDLKLLG